MKQIPINTRYSIDEAGSRIVCNETGRVITMREQRVKGKGTGYIYATLCFFPYDYKPIAVHRLVAFTYHENPNNYKEVNHIDHNRSNNNATNLEWCTHQQNMAHSMLNRKEAPKGEDHWRYGKKASLETKRKQSVSKLGKNHPKFKGYYIVFDRPYASSYEAERATGINYKTIWRRCKQGKQGTNYWFQSTTNE